MLVLGVSMILTVVGLSVLTVARIQTRMTSRENDWVEAQVLAFSGIEHALTLLNTTPNWRNKYKHGQTAETAVLGQGSFEWKLTDEADSDLGDDASDPFSITSTGAVNQASFTLRVRVTPSDQSLSVDLGSCERVVY